MKRIAILVAALMLAGCAHKAERPPQRGYTKTAKIVQQKPAEAPTPAQQIKRRWMPKFKIQWLHK